VRAGRHDNSFGVRVTLAALKRGRELAGSSQ